jgi:hypothetical protein
VTYAALKFPKHGLVQCSLSISKEINTLAPLNTEANPNTLRIPVTWGLGPSCSKTGKWLPLGRNVKVYTLDQHHYILQTGSSLQHLYPALQSWQGLTRYNTATGSDSQDPICKWGKSFNEETTNLLKFVKNMFSFKKF